MKKYIFYWVGFFLLMGLVVFSLDPERFAAQRLNQALTHIEQAEQAPTLASKKYHYGQALSDISKLKQQFPDSAVYASLMRDRVVDIGKLQTKYNQLTPQYAPLAPPDYLAQALHLIQQQAQYERLEHLLQLAPTMRAKATPQQMASYRFTLKQLIEIESNATALCQAYEVLAWQSKAEDNHRWLDQISQLLSGNINQQMQRHCMAAYFNIASSTSYIPDASNLAHLWQIEANTLYSQYSEALVRHGFFNLAEAQQQKITDPLLLAQAELFQLKAQWPGLTPLKRREQALLDVAINLANITAKEQKELQTLRLAEFLFHQQAVSYASAFASKIYQPLSQAWYDALALNANDLQSYQERNLDHLHRIVTAYRQAEQPVKLKLGFHELMDIWLKDQIATTEKGTFNEVGQLLFRHYLAQPERRDEITQWLVDLEKYHSIEQVKALILFQQQAPNATQALMALTQDQALDVLELILQQQDPALLTRWLKEPFLPRMQIANLIRLAQWQAGVKE